MRQDSTGGTLGTVLRAVLLAFALSVILCAAGVSQETASPSDRFALSNRCEPIGVVIEALPDGMAASGLSTPHLQAMAESRLRAVSLHESDAPTFLRLAASRNAVELLYMKPVIDVASREKQLVSTYSVSAEVSDRTAAGLMLEVSRLLDLFLTHYSRVNRVDCAATNQKGRSVREGMASDRPGEARERGAASDSGPSPTATDTPRMERSRVADGVGSDTRLSETESTDGDAKLHRVGDEITSPRLIRKVAPEYTRKAKNARLEGVVTLGIEVWEDGKAHNIRVLQGLGLGLDEKAVEAARQWVFKPGQKGDQPVRVAAQIEMRFSLIFDP